VTDLSKPFNRDWHEVRFGDRCAQLQVRYGLSSRATALIEGLSKSRIFGKEAEFEEAMAIYLSELESEIIEARREE
jgi:hypothetical protein